MILPSSSSSSFVFPGEVNVCNLGQKGLCPHKFFSTVKRDSNCIISFYNSVAPNLGVSKT